MRYQRPVNKVFRRNLVVAIVCHLLMLVVVCLFEKFGGLPGRNDDAKMMVEIFTPADVLGDMPKGDGYGRGAYTSPSSRVPGGQTASLVSSLPLPTPPPPVPSQPPVKAPQVPSKVTAPKKSAPKKKTVPVAKPSTKPNQASSARSGTNAASTKPVRKPGLSQAQVKNLLAGALEDSGVGTPHGDGQKAGGGEGRSQRIGSPNGSLDGVVGGSGKGSKNWRYYQHVHDRMYDAWNQPVELQGSRLSAVVSLTIARDGRITNVTLVRSSGNGIMDQSVIDAARSVKQLNSLPADLGNPTATITVEFELEGR